jgi:hypothetical protein
VELALNMNGVTLNPSKENNPVGIHLFDFNTQKADN